MSYDLTFAHAGGPSAMLVAGEDRYGYWDRDVEPRMDLDPRSLAFLDQVWSQYRDDTVTSQVARA